MKALRDLPKYPSALYTHRTASRCHTKNENKLQKLEKLRPASLDIINYLSGYIIQCVDQCQLNLVAYVQTIYTIVIIAQL